MKTLQEVKDKLGQLLGIDCEGRCDNCCFNKTECLLPLIDDTLEHICTLERIRATQASTITSLRDAVSKHQLVQSRMQEEISRLESQIPRWIPVEEMLPEKHAGVIVCCDDGFVFLMTHDGKHWNWNGRYEDSVTHWMPLPEPPKELEG